MEWKINGKQEPLPVNSNNTKIIITSVDIHHQTIIADNKVFKHVAEHLNVAYKISFNGVHEATGAMLIYPDDTPLDELPLWKIAYIVTTRLGIPYAIE